METGRHISIQIGGGVAHSAVCVRMIHGTIEATTEKAVQVRLGRDLLWLPKKALAEKRGKYDVWYALARWFRPNDYQWRVIERHEHIGGQSAA